MTVRVVRWVLWFILFIGLICRSENGFADSQVDLIHDSYAASFIDFELDGFRLYRSYNSRLRNVGLFGLGWCTLLEARLKLENNRPHSLELCGRSLALDSVEKIKNEWRLKFDAYHLSESKTNEMQNLIFDETGRLREMTLPSKYPSLPQIAFRLEYDAHDHILSIMTPHHKLIQFLYNPLLPRFISHVQIGQTIAARYQTNREGHLTEVTNQWGNRYNYKYNGLGLLNRIDYPDRSSEMAHYQTGTDQVDEIHGRDGCHELYQFNRRSVLSTVVSARKICARSGRSKRVTLEMKYRMRTDRTLELAQLAQVDASPAPLRTIATTSTKSMTNPSHPIVVAVIDTGIDRNHELLKNNIWTNSGEVGIDHSGRNKQTNQVDDDGNGFVDDVHGWSFSGDDNNPEDHHGHGTHIAGLVLKNAPDAVILPIQYFDPNHQRVNTVEASVRAIDYAIQMHAQIINYSGGGTEASERERDALARAAKHGILVVAASGNDHADIDVKPYFPAAYGLNNILSVSAITSQGKLSEFSNFGQHKVVIGALGNSLESARPHGGTAVMSGTSQATALVSGAAAQLMKARRDLATPEALIAALANSGQWRASLSGSTRSERSLDLERATALRLPEQNASGDSLAETMSESISGVMSETLFTSKQIFVDAKESREAKPRMPSSNSTAPKS